MRNGPGPGDAIVATIAADGTAWYALQGRDAVYPGWWQIRYSPIVTGWVVADSAVETEGNLNLAPPPRASLAISTQACAVRTKPGSAAAKVATIAGRQHYPLCGTGTGCCDGGLVPDPLQQQHDRLGTGEQGCNCTAKAAICLSSGPLSTAYSHPRVSPKASTTVGMVGINVRFKPGSNHRTVVTLPIDSARTYDILGQDAATANWYQIRVSAVLTGWVPREYVQTHGDLGDIPRPLIRFGARDEEQSHFPSPLLVPEPRVGLELAPMTVVPTWLSRPNSRIRKSLPVSRHRRIN